MEKKGTKFISKLGGILMPGSSDPGDIRGSLVVSDPAVSFSSRKCECPTSYSRTTTPRTQHSTHSLRLPPSVSGALYKIPLALLLEKFEGTNTLQHAHTRSFPLSLTHHYSPQGFKCHLLSRKYVCTLKEPVRNHCPVSLLSFCLTPLVPSYPIALDLEGIFRLNGPMTEVDRYKKILNEGTHAFVSAFY